MGEIIWPLLSGFTNAFLLTRATQYFLKFTKLSGRFRAYFTFFLISTIDLIGLVIYFGNLRAGISVLLFFYMPFLVMWLMKDLLEVSRKEREQAQAKESGQEEQADQAE